MDKKKSTYLKKTNQLVHVLPWIGQDKKPWPQGYTQIFRPFLDHEGSRTKNKGEVIVVKDSSLIERRYEG